MISNRPLLSCVTLVFTATIILCAAEERAGAQSAGPPAVVKVCMPCHGVNGQGHDVETPTLAGQSGIYLYAALRTPLAGLCDLIWLNMAARRMAHAGS
ncbi:MAG: c-type cytochrome [Candidatus Sulfotelmatobacter sp.]